MMTGLLRSKGTCVSPGKVRQSLKRLDPAYHQIRHETAGRSLNPKAVTQIILVIKYMWTKMKN